MSTPHVVVMGIAGSGKTTVGRKLAERLDWPFADGDDFHPESNVARMRSGLPLTDEQRQPWLRAIAEWLAGRRAEGRRAVVACSALRRAYRDVLRTAPGGVVFVHLTAEPLVIRDRLRRRTGHFMPASLLDTQVATLEPLAPDETGLTLAADLPVDDIVRLAVEELSLAGT